MTSPSSWRGRCRLTWWESRRRRGIRTGGRTQCPWNGSYGTEAYDFLIDATGPKLNFGATPGLGPDGHSLSVCTDAHAAATSHALDVAVERMRRGERHRFLVGTGHGACTCESAAFEYAVNLEFELRARGVRDKADIQWITNEHELGDFGMGGMHFTQGGYVTPGRIFMESLFAERGISATTKAHVRQVEAGQAHYETIDGHQDTAAFDFAMLLPPFSGVGLTAVDRAGAAAHRHALRHDRQGGGSKHRGHAAGRDQPDAPHVDGDDGRRLRSLGRRESVHRHGRVTDGLPDRARLLTVPGVWP
ncbi:MAG: hypothetical protein JNL48_22230 [Acidobacteria bacterium]|nr:hypothetical protein [Acidobacteriota bacterium]